MCEPPVSGMNQVTRCLQPAVGHFWVPVAFTVGFPEGDTKPLSGNCIRRRDPLPISSVLGATGSAEGGGKRHNTSHALHRPLQPVKYLRGSRSGAAYSKLSCVQRCGPKGTPRYLRQKVLQSHSLRDCTYYPCTVTPPSPHSLWPESLVQVLGILQSK